MQSDLSQQHITELIEETVYRRVQKTIQQYVDKNHASFAANKIAGIEWSLQLTVLVDNLGLNPIPKPSLSKRFLNAIKNIFRKKASQAS